MAKVVVIRNAKWARQLWVEAVAAAPEIEGLFHLRPNVNSATLVTIHESRRLNGNSNLGKKALKDAISDIVSQLKAGCPKQQIVDAYIKNLSGSSKKEAAIQASILRDWERFSDILKGKLGLSELTFVASELILQEGTTRDGQRADIVAYGDDSIVFIELKRPDNSDDNPVEQVARYMKTYQPMDEFYELINNYPISTSINVKRDRTRLVGVAVYGYNESTPSFSQETPIAQGNIFTMKFQ